MIAELAAFNVSLRWNDSLQCSAKLKTGEANVMRER